MSQPTPAPSTKHQAPSTTGFLARLHARMGDFWWYSLMMFVALRCGDVINAVVGLWLVPKYVPQEELGAVLPLTQFATTFGLPISILVLVFTKYLAQFKAKGELGKVKSLLRWFLGFVMAASILSIALAKFTLPALFERIRIQDGSLTLLIIATGIIGTVAPVFNNALQGLKKFKTITFLNLIGAPIRLVSMLLLLPIRALSGYMAGQLIPSIVAIVTSTFSIRKDINKSVVSVPFWRDDLKPMLRFAACCAGTVIPCTVLGMIQTMIIRQRLPEVESAAYYLMSRFAELGTYAGTTMAFIMFPYATEASINKKNAYPLLLKMSVGTLAFGLLCTAILWLLGAYIFELVPIYHEYACYANDMVLLSFIMTINLVGSNYTSFETAHGRFGFFLWAIPFGLLRVGFLVCFTGYTFFYGILPKNVVDWMGSLHIASLRNLLLVLLTGAIITNCCYATQLFLRYLKSRRYGK